MDQYGAVSGSFVSDTDGVEEGGVIVVWVPHSKSHQQQTWKSTVS